MSKPKFIRMPIYDEIGISEFVFKLLKNRWIQRLRFIHQAGVSFIDFPNMVHSRFTHSLGTLQLCQKIIKNSNLDEKEGKRLLFSALTHHILEPPFSYLGIDALRANHKEAKVIADIVISDLKESLKNACEEYDDYKDIIDATVEWYLAGYFPTAESLYLSYPSARVMVQYEIGRFDSVVQDLYWCDGQLLPGFRVACETIKIDCINSPRGTSIYKVEFKEPAFNNDFREFFNSAADFSRHAIHLSRRRRIRSRLMERVITRILQQHKVLMEPDVYFYLVDDMLTTFLTQRQSQWFKPMLSGMPDYSWLFTSDIEDRVTSISLESLSEQSVDRLKQAIKKNTLLTEIEKWISDKKNIDPAEVLVGFNIPGLSYEIFWRNLAIPDDLLLKSKQNLATAGNQLNRMYQEKDEKVSSFQNCLYIVKADGGKIVLNISDQEEIGNKVYEFFN